MKDLYMSSQHNFFSRSGYMMLYNQVFLKYWSLCCIWDSSLNLSDFMVHFLFWSICIDINTHLTFFLRYILPYNISPGPLYLNIAYYFCFKTFFKKIRRTSLRFLLLYSFILDEMSKNHNFRTFYFTFQGIMHHLKRKYSSKSCC